MMIEEALSKITMMNLLSNTKRFCFSLQGETNEQHCTNRR